MHCQIIDALHQGVVPINKVNFSAKSEYEYIANYKILQSAFNKLGVDKQIDVNKLIKARPVDNLEFLQWMKHYYDTKTAGGAAALDYNPVERREKAKGGAFFARSSSSSSSSAAANPGTSGRSATPKPGPSSGSGTQARRPVSARSTGDHQQQQQRGTGGEAEKEKGKVRELEARVGQLRVAQERAEQEREFYFEKLQDIEQLCQRPEFRNEPLVQVVEAILYHEEGRPDLDACIASAFSADAHAAADAAAASEEDNKENQPADHQPPEKDEGHRDGSKRSLSLEFDRFDERGLLATDDDSPLADNAASPSAALPQEENPAAS